MRRPNSRILFLEPSGWLCLPRSYIVNSHSQTPRLNLQVPGVHAGRVGAGGRAVGLTGFGLSYGFDLEGAWSAIHHWRVGKRDVARYSFTNMKLARELV